MVKMSEIAIRECVTELRAGTRRPMEPSAVEMVVEWLRPQYEKILDRLDGPRRWADHGARVRENSRHVGALADFFACHTGVATIGIPELTHAMTLVRADCTVRAERTPLAFQYCPTAPVDLTAAEAFLRALAPNRDLACCG
jgi:hypothetical protein